MKISSAPLAAAGRGAASALWQTVAGGGGPAAAPGRAHRALIGLIAVLAGVLAFFPHGRAEVGALFLAVALTAFSVALTLVHPLWAWRVLIVVVALANQFYGDHARFGWPWSGGLALAAVPVLTAVGRNQRPGVLAWVWLISAGVSALHANVRDELAPIAVLLAIPLAFGWLVSRLRGTQRDLAEEAARRAVLEERTRIARELHDVVAHHMSVLAMRADSARYRFPGLDDGLREEFQAIQDTARTGMTEMRRLLGLLRDGRAQPETEPQPGAERIEELVERVRAAGTDVRFERRGEYGGLPDGVALSAYRIVQEGLSNAVRHAPGAPVEVSVRIGPGELRLTVRDSGAATGVPEDTAGREKHGLLGMRERAAALGGTFTAGRRDGGGFAVTVTVPLD
ncbi:sensor histidine kinase [Amycolatopsis saalfeldensis]|uniref:histidine kinase n=1 Tax=Amycolatopsis saalfeldensis TaxID=394193 RepID=A0A1H8U920_9PSEU|nr:sensor histidine kinase [Amycolatopsis saalfeldensis]SEO99344.1 Signal transduction histidine kinase [Amycolatopsis saalfeldensis]